MFCVSLHLWLFSLVKRINGNIPWIMKEKLKDMWEGFLGGMFVIAFMLGFITIMFFLGKLLGMYLHFLNNL